MGLLGKLEGGSDAYEGEQGALVLGAAHGLWTLQGGEEGDNKGENIK